MSREPRPYPPDFVSADTLAHRLDCSKSTVAGYVRRGLLPEPLKIGELVRWRWADVERFVLEHGPREVYDIEDPYLKGLSNATPEEADD